MSPRPTGSLTATMTMGMVVVACMAAWAAGNPSVTMSSTGTRTSSVARVGSRSESPSAYRLSTVMFCPSTQPSARKPCPKASRRRGIAGSEGELSDRTPMRGTFTVCCASPASGATRMVRARIRRSPKRRRVMGASEVMDVWGHSTRHALGKETTFCRVSCLKPYGRSAGTPACSDMSGPNRSQLMWVQADVLGLFLGSVGSFSDNVGLSAIIFSDNVGTKRRCFRAERFMLSRRYTFRYRGGEPSITPRAALA